MRPPQQALIADHVFDGTAVHDDMAVVIDGSRISALVPRKDLPAATAACTLPEGIWLAPGFIDVQVNGGGDVLFNDATTVEGIRAIAAAHRQFGTTALLPTLISDAPQKMSAALAAARAVIGKEPGILGIHLEGPFLSPEKPGVHALHHIRAPAHDDEVMLTAEQPGSLVMTLAPECVPDGFIRRLAAAGVRICLGHSNATYLETRAAMAEGLTGFTHLFNAMRPLASREPGPIGAALESHASWFGMIVDGVHVDPVLLRLALRGNARPMLVTDAMPPVGGKQTCFSLYGETIHCDRGRCVRQDGTLAGTNLDMATAVRNYVRLLGLPLESALRFASAHPASFLGVERWLGYLAPGYRADLVAIDPATIEVTGVWSAGIDQRPLAEPA